MVQVGLTGVTAGFACMYAGLVGYDEVMVSRYYSHKSEPGPV
jgi:hypothetical protein